MEKGSVCVGVCSRPGFKGGEAEAALLSGHSKSFAYRNIYNNDEKAWNMCGKGFFPYLLSYL